jgi:hypothetical protein
MNKTQIIALLLALSCSVNIAFTAGIIARTAGASLGHAALTAAAAGGTAMTIFFAGVSAYH